MKRVHLLSALALVATLLSNATAQKYPSGPTLVEEEAQTVEIDPRAIRVQHVRIGGDFQPAGELPDPCIYLQTMWLRRDRTGGAAFSFTSLSPSAAVPSRADDVVLFGGSAIDPQIDDPNNPTSPGYSREEVVGCISEIAVLLYNPATSPSTVTLTLELYRWNGLFGAPAIVQDLFFTTANLPAADRTFTIDPQTLALLTINVRAINNGNPLPVPKAFWVRLVPSTQTPVGWVIANSVPGNTSLLPGRGYFRNVPTTTSNFVFIGLPQGSFFLAIRGTHNFVGQLNLGRLADRAKPNRPLAFEFDEDPSGDPDAGIEEALRRNIVDVEVFNSTANPPFTSRFSTYLDENGRFTIPVTNDIASITVRRWDNALKVTFNRPDGGWSQNPCQPTTASAPVIFGDVNGDGVINNEDVLEVLFNFGAGE